MKILLTGATGFLGSSILLQLVQSGHSAVIILRKTSNIFRISSVISKVETIVIDEVIPKDIFFLHRIDLILHCATDYGHKQTEPAELCETNLILPLRLLQYGRKAGVKFFVNTDTILDKGVSHYSLSKNQFKEWLMLSADEMTCINVAIEHFYGPTDDPTKFISFLVNNLVDNLDSIDLTMGEQKRNFIYIDDVVKAFITIIDSLNPSSTGYFHYEIGSDNTMSIKDFAKLVKKISGATHTQLNFGALPYRSHEVMEACVDLSAIKNLGWSPKTELEDGLLKTIESAKKLRDR